MFVDDIWQFVFAFLGGFFAFLFDAFLQDRLCKK